jgi:hypothetical protein
MFTSYAVLLTVSLVGQPMESPPFVREYSKTGTYYYRSPDPQLGPRMLKELLRKENLEHPFFVKNDQVLLLIGAQLGDIAAGHAKIVREYEAAYADATTKGRRVIVRSLTNCGDRETVKRVDAWLADRPGDLRPELEALKKHLEDPKRKHVRDRPAREPKDLDLLWANFFVTGEYAPVSRILDVFDLPDARETQVLKRVARWSLGSNLQQHPRLLEIVQKHKKERPDGSRKVVDELILTFPPKKEKK